MLDGLEARSPSTRAERERESRRAGRRQAERERERERHRPRERTTSVRSDLRDRSEISELQGGSHPLSFTGLKSPQLSRKWTHYATTVLFLVFGAYSLWEGVMEDEKESELAEVEAKMDGQLKSANGFSAGKQAKIDDDDHDLKKHKKPSLAARYFSPIFLEAFSLTFLGEWGDRSQIATVGLAAAENVIGVTLGGILGQSLCTCAAVWGGKHLASRISEKAVAICGGVLFIIFGIHSIVSGYTEIV